ncbi:MAG: hypothetical protein R3D26_12430 [Cyanobacteriota/Melainabacteria group bacterium]
MDMMYPVTDEHSRISDYDLNTALRLYGSRSIFRYRGGESGKLLPPALLPPSSFSFCFQALLTLLQSKFLYLDADIIHIFL